MKRYILLGLTFVILLLIGISCEKSAEKLPSSECSTEALQQPQMIEFISSAPLAEKYYPLWKSRFMKRNNLSEDFFNKYITVHYVDTAINRFNDAVELVIMYTYQSGWAISGAGERMTIQINNSSSTLFSNTIPINKPLDSLQIESLSSSNPASLPHYYYPVSTNIQLKFKSLNDAREAIRKYLKIEKLCNVSVGINEIGELELRYSDGSATGVSGGGYPCRDVQLNLINGKITMYEGVCES